MYDRRRQARAPKAPASKAPSGVHPSISALTLIPT